MKKFLDTNGLLYLWGKVKTLVRDSVAAAGGGDMLKSVYDTDGDGVVDDAKKANGHTVSADVPSGARFTDTTYGAATAEADGLLSKADYAKLAAFGAAGTYALKADLTALYKYKGSKDTVADLPAEGSAAGDVWDVAESGMNYAWNGAAWDALGALLEVEGLTNAEIDAATA